MHPENTTPGGEPLGATPWQLYTLAPVPARGETFPVCLAGPGLTVEKLFSRDEWADWVGYQFRFTGQRTPAEPVDRTLPYWTFDDEGQPFYFVVTREYAWYDGSPLIASINWTPPQPLRSWLITGAPWGLEHLLDAGQAMLLLEARPPILVDADELLCRDIECKYWELRARGGWRAATQMKVVTELTVGVRQLRRVWNARRPPWPPRPPKRGR